MGPAVTGGSGWKRRNVDTAETEGAEMWGWGGEGMGGGGGRGGGQRRLGMGGEGVGEGCNTCSVLSAGGCVKCI